jgi:hypothetical protein
VVELGDLGGFLEAEGRFAGGGIALDEGDVDVAGLGEVVEVESVRGDSRWFGVSECSDVQNLLGARTGWWSLMGGAWDWYFRQGFDRKCK